MYYYNTSIFIIIHLIYYNTSILPCINLLFIIITCIQNVTTRMMRPRMDSAVVQTVISMGYKREHVTTTVSNRLKVISKLFQHLL